jgi:hypothetical protein
MERGGQGPDCRRELCDVGGRGGRSAQPVQDAGVHLASRRPAGSGGDRLRQGRGRRLSGTAGARGRRHRGDAGLGLYPHSTRFGSEIGERCGDGVAGRSVIGPSGAVRVLVATKPVDFRKGAEGLAALVREELGADPFGGAGLCLSRQAGRSDQAGVLGRHGFVPLRQAAGGRRVSLAQGPRRCDAAQFGSARSLARGPGLATRPSSQAHAHAGGGGVGFCLRQDDSPRPRGRLKSVWMCSNSCR